MLVFVVTSIANCLINTMSTIGDYSIHSKELFENTFMFKFDESRVFVASCLGPTLRSANGQTKRKESMF